MTKNFKLLVHVIIAVMVLVFFAYIQLRGHENLDTSVGHYFQVLLLFTPLLGGIFGINTARHWSGLKSMVGRGIFFISLGLLAWALGQIIWVIYNFTTTTEVPYPSFADVGYLLAIPFWATGVFYLSKATGAKYALRGALGKVAVRLVELGTAHDGDDAA